MNVARSLVSALAIATSTFEPNATMTRMTTSVATVTSATPASIPANAITTSIVWDVDNSGAGDILGDTLYLPTTGLTLQGSIVSVGPSGTVIDIACPYTHIASASAACSLFDQAYTYTLRPGYEGHEFSLTTSTVGINILVKANSDCTVKDKDYVCDITATASVSSGGQKASSTSTTHTTAHDPTYTPLYITGGIEKATATPQSTGGAGSLKAGSALVVAAAVAATLFAL